MKYQKDDQVYYQNNPATFVSYLNDETVVVVVSSLPDFENTDMTGTCMGCNVGDSDNKLACTCEDAVYALEMLEENTEPTLIPLVVNIKMLHEKPIEVIKHQKRIDDMYHQNVIKVNKQKEVLSSVVKDQKSTTAVIKMLSSIEDNLNKRILAKVDIVKQLEDKEIALLLDQTRIMSELNSTVKIGETSKSIKVRQLLKLHKDSITLNLLKIGGVDNWAWYGESIGDNDIEAMALEQLL